MAGSATQTRTALFALLALVFLLQPPAGRGRRQTVEEVTKKHMEALLEEEDYLAVFWCKSDD